LAPFFGDFPCLQGISARGLWTLPLSGLPKVSFFDLPPPTQFRRFGLESRFSARLLFFRVSLPHFSVFSFLCFFNRLNNYDAQKNCYSRPVVPADVFPFSSHPQKSISHPREWSPCPKPLFDYLPAPALHSAGVL